MKKAKFKLGLMISMLFMGANVMNAAHDISKPHYGSINVTLSAKASEFYDGSGIIDGNKGITFKQVAIDKNGVYQYTASELLWDKFPIENDFGPETKKTWNYGSGKKGDPDFSINEDRTSSGFLNYYYQNPVNGFAGLFYYQVKSQTTVYNEINIYSKYFNGNELTPVIKRTITLGEWVPQGDPDQTKNDPVRNELRAIESPIIVDFLEPTDFWFLPEMDRASSFAKYTYQDDMLALLDKYPIIKAIKYEISLNDEVGTPGEGDHQLPVYVDRTTMRGLTIEAEDGITTNPNTIGTGGIIYVQSQKDFVFTASCDEEIEVITDRGMANDVDVKSDGEGTYTIKIKKVQSNFKIYLKKVVITESGAGGDNDETGNETLSEYAAWGANGTLYVKTAAAATLTIYNVTGQQIKQTKVNGNASFPMPKGLYIVQLNGKAYKIVL
ncbi:MAG: T9SS type A sorting domain-containing protein [Tannerellaceae bacterium]|jgi:hypothetical protein|nr:T9SS type A sorting domain-containing protein [Tannerellaceae bacterium]